MLSSRLWMVVSVLALVVAIGAAVFAAAMRQVSHSQAALIATLEDRLSALEQTKDVVKAKRFTVVDDAGDPKVVVGAKDGCGFLGTVGKNKEKSIFVGADEKGQPVMHLIGTEYYSTVGGDHVVIRDKSSKMALALTARDGVSAIGLYGTGAEPAMSLSTGQGGGGILEIYNPLGKMVATVQSSKVNSGMVIVRNHNGEKPNTLTPFEESH